MNTEIPTRIDVLRHGECEGGKIFRGTTDVALSKHGWQQMHAAVSGIEWDQIICSPLARCRDFSEHLGQRRGTPVHVESAWREFDFGSWEGRPCRAVWEEQPEVFRQFCADPSTCTPEGGEPYTEVQQRVAHAWRSLAAAHAGKRVLVVTHGGICRALYLHLMALPGAEFSRLEVPYACLSRWVCYPGVSADKPALQFHNIRRNPE